MQKLVEIAKALLQDGPILVRNDPSTDLFDHEIEQRAYPTWETQVKQQGWRAPPYSCSGSA